MKVNNNTKKQNNKENYNFKVFENYKCDGQYVMEFKDDEITIKEELTDKLDNKHI